MNKWEIEKINRLVFFTIQDVLGIIIITKREERIKKVRE
jgi:hypothetical protein